MGLLFQGNATTHEVATNAAKLLLTNISVGDRAFITNEGGRLEEYLGGDIDDDESWLVLIDTVEIIIFNDDTYGFPVTVNGVVCDYYTLTNAGWAKTGDVITIELDPDAVAAGGSDPGQHYPVITRINDVPQRLSTTSSSTPPWMILESDNTGEWNGMRLPFPIPPRSSCVFGFYGQSI
jgi:hypothetical protein